MKFTESELKLIRLWYISEANSAGMTAEERILGIKIANEIDILAGKRMEKELEDRLLWRKTRKAVLNNQLSKKG